MNVKFLHFCIICKQKIIVNIYEFKTTIIAKKFTFVFKYGTIIYTKEGMCMQVQAINNQSFSGNPREAGSKRRANIDAAIALSDSDLRRAAFYQACLQTDEEKHNKIDRAAILSLPVIAAARDSILSRGQDVKFFNGVLYSSPAARVITGLKTLGRWGAAIGIAAGVVAATDKLEEKSPKFRRFAKEQPYTMLAGAFATAVGLNYAAQKGVNKLGEKIINRDIQKSWHNISDKVVKFNENKLVKNVVKKYANLTAKMHPALKGIGAIGLAAAPLVIGVGTIIHSLNHSSVRNKQAVQNYTNLKTAQAVLANARARELAELQ